MLAHYFQFTMTLTDPSITHEDRTLCSALDSVTCTNDGNNYDINLFKLFTSLSSFWYNANTKHNLFCNQKSINISRDSPLVQPFSCSPLKGRENDALATSCWMQQTLDKHSVVHHCPLLISFGQVSWISSLPALYFVLVCRSGNR